MQNFLFLCYNELGFGIAFFCFCGEVVIADNAVNLGEIAIDSLEWLINLFVINEIVYPRGVSRYRFKKKIVESCRYQAAFCDSARREKHFINSVSCSVLYSFRAVKHTWRFNDCTAKADDLHVVRGEVCCKSSEKLGAC